MDPFEIRQPGLFVIPANDYDLSVTSEDESAEICSGATDASRTAGLIRAYCLCQTGYSTDEPSAPF